MNSSQHEASDSLSSFVGRLTQLMPHLCRAMVKRESDHLTRGELTLPQVWALERLRRQGPLHMNELLQALQLKASTGTVFVDRLCRLRLVKRQRDASDRRVVRVAITAKGRRVLDDIDRIRRDSLRHVFSHLSAAERRRYLSIIEKLVYQLSDKEDTP